MFAELMRVAKRALRGAGSQEPTARKGRLRQMANGIELLEDRRVLSQTVGLFVNDAESFDGYTLWGPLRESGTYLVNNEGDLVHKWNSEYRPNANYLLEDGSLLRTAQLDNLSWGAGGSSGRVEQLDWNSNVIWSFELASNRQLLHHDLAPIMNPDGSLHSVLMIAWEKFTFQESLALGRSPSLPTDNNGELWSEMIIEVVPDYDNGVGGEIIWEWHLSDHVTTNPAANPQLVDINYQGGVGNSATLADWAHFNGIDYNPILDQIVISPRDFSEIWVIDHSTTTAQAARHTGGSSGMGGDLLYRWGNPAAYGRGTPANQKLFFQHNPTWIPPGRPGEGNILIYNNGSFRPDGSEFSEVLEITPPQNHQWILNNRTDGSIYDLSIFDTMGDVPSSWVPLTGDWDNDGRDSSGFYDPTAQRWYLDNSTELGTSGSIFDTQQLGVDSSWRPVTGDWDNDGFDSVGLYDTNTGDWYLSNAHDAWDAVTSIAGPTQSPAPNLLPIAGNWNGKGGDGVGLYDPSTNRWIMNNQLNGSLDDLIVFQISQPHPTWKPIIGDWNRDGIDTAGLYDPLNHRWYLNNRSDGSIGDLTTINAPLVPSTWRPITGDWNGNGQDTVGLYNPQFITGNYNILPGMTFGPAVPAWRYAAQPRSAFYSSIISGAQRLPNGNTLIDEGTSGRLFEVTPNGKTVWEYVNPVTNRGPLMQGTPIPGFGVLVGVQANFVFRALRYGPDYPGLQGKTLMSQGPIELYPEFGLYDQSAGNFYLSSDLPNGNEVHESSVNPVQTNWLAIAGDWDGDGIDSVGLYDPMKSEFHLDNTVSDSFDGYTFQVTTLGLTRSWLPIAGDWNNDGTDTVGLYDPTTNNWYFSNAVGEWNAVHMLPAPARVPANWKPIAGDWNGDGFDSVGLFVPGANRWYLNNKIDGSKNDLYYIDAPDVPTSWIPIAGDWNENGRDSVGLYDAARNSWILNNKTNGSIDDLEIFTTPQVPLFGQPVLGDWNGSKSQPLITASYESASPGTPAVQDALARDVADTFSEQPEAEAWERVTLLDLVVNEMGPKWQAPLY